MTVVLVVDFEVEPSRIDDFTRAIVENARASLTEPGCGQFDVCQDPREPARFLLYERYDDDAAIAAHLATSHYHRFDAEVTPWTRFKVVRRLDLVAG